MSPSPTDTQSFLMTFFYFCQNLLLNKAPGTCKTKLTRRGKDKQKTRLAILRVKKIRSADLISSLDGCRREVSTE